MLKLSAAKYLYTWNIRIELFLKLIVHLSKEFFYLQFGRMVAALSKEIPALKTARTSAREFIDAGSVILLGFTCE